MEAQITIKRKVLILIAPLLILGSLYILTFTKSFTSGNPELVQAMSLDLILTLPLVYLLLIWKTSIPNITAIPIGLIGLFIGFQLIPEANQGILLFVMHWIFPILEIGIFIFVFLKIRKLRKEFISHKELDFYDSIQIAAKSIFPSRVAELFATEIACIYYGLIKWKSKPISTNEFTHHKNSGTAALLYILIFIVGVELFVFHLLLVDNYPIIAWILTILSAYSALQLLAFGKSISQRFYSIKTNEMILNYGILAKAQLNFGDIESIEKSALNAELSDNIKTLSPFGLIDAHNVHIKFKSPQVFDSLYGFKKEVKELLLFVDNRDEFVQQVRKKLD